MAVRERCAVMMLVYPCEYPEQALWNPMIRWVSAVFQAHNWEKIKLYSPQPIGNLPFKVLPISFILWLMILTCSQCMTRVYRPHWPFHCYYFISILALLGAIVSVRLSVLPSFLPLPPSLPTSFLLLFITIRSNLPTLCLHDCTWKQTFPTGFGS